MTVSIPNLPAEVLARYEASATAHGLSLDDFLREYLIRHTPESDPARPSAEEWERALDDCLDGLAASGEAAGPLPDSAFDRDGIYTREDNW